MSIVTTKLFMIDRSSMCPLRRILPRKTLLKQALPPLPVVVDHPACTQTARLKPNCTHVKKPLFFSRINIHVNSAVSRRLLHNHSGVRWTYPIKIPSVMIFSRILYEFLVLNSKTCVHFESEQRFCVHKQHKKGVFEICIFKHSETHPI